MEIRRAEEADMPRIEELLRQVNLVHHKGRPDLFKYGARKYTDEELRVLIHDDSRPIFVALDGAGTVQGYAFCIFQQYVNHNIMTDIKTLYIDDLCVDEACPRPAHRHGALPPRPGLCARERLLQRDAQRLEPQRERDEVLPGAGPHAPEGRHGGPALIPLQGRIFPVY